MTREEIIEAIQNDDMMPFLQDWQARDIVDFVLKNIQPSLPDGLEEAAEEYNKQVIEATKCHHNALTYAEGYEDALLLIPDAFIAGAKYVAPRWISVDEKLPEMDEEVIVLTDELGTAPIYKISFGHIVDVERCIDYNGWNCPGVMYWMPCPEIPNND